MDKKYRKSLSTFTRNEVRILIAIRTGHGQLNHYRYTLFNKGSTALCTCQKGPQTTRHHLTKCTIPTIIRQRRKMVKLGKQTHTQYIQSLSPSDYDTYLQHNHPLDYTQPLTFTDPPFYYDSSTSQILQRAIIALYRNAVQCYNIKIKDR